MMCSHNACTVAATQKVHTARQANNAEGNQGHHIAQVDQANLGKHLPQKSIKYDKTTQVVLSHRRRGNPLRLAKCPDTTKRSGLQPPRLTCKNCVKSFDGQFIQFWTIDIIRVRMGIFDNLWIFSTFWGPERTSSSTSKLEKDPVEPSPISKLTIEARRRAGWSNVWSAPRGRGQGPQQPWSLGHLNSPSQKWVHKNCQVHIILAIFQHQRLQALPNTNKGI